MSPLFTRSALIVAAAAITAFAGTAQAEIYRWIDSNGVVNYSNLPPADARSARVVASDNISVVQSPRVSAAEAQELTDRIADQQTTVQAPVASAMVPTTTETTYYPPQLNYPPTVRRANQRAQAYGMEPVPYGIGAPSAPLQPVRYRELRR
jgi:hypothetical protein